MKKMTALALLITLVGSVGAQAATTEGAAAGSEATTMSEGDSNAVGVGAVGALLGVALATMGGGGDGDGSTTSTGTTTNTVAH
ncbi:MULTISPECIES: exopolysaccharide production protein YjbE [Erwinia]|uniref:exopolysaccharide production protein YjbE n=1 Tax=Erwinia TaxID=551 RepID=UPI0005518EEC|nr:MULTISPECIES: exopolysaccharide production protein YjbE [Erwinia]